MAQSAKNKKAFDGSETTVQLATYPARKYFNAFITVVLTIAFTGWIWANLQRKTVPWYVIAIPIIFIGMLTNFLQDEEEWQYTAWQNSTQKYEKNIYD
jgi:hypothetical protein